MFLTGNSFTIDPERIDTIQVLETIEAGRSDWRRAPQGGAESSRGSGFGGTARHWRSGGALA